MKWQLIAFPIVFTGVSFGGIYALFNFTEQVDPKVNTHKLEPLILKSESSPTIWRNQYHFQGRFFILPFALSSNMYLFELPSSENSKKEFLIYNPTCLTPELKQNLETLLQQQNGTLKYLILGAVSHNLFFEDYLQHFPNLQLYCPPQSTKILSKTLKDKTLEQKLQEIQVDPQTGAWQPLTTALGKQHSKNISLYYLHGTEGTIQEIVMINKANQFLAVTDSAHFVVPNKTFVTKENQDSSLSTLYAKYAGVYNKFGVNRIFGEAVRSSYKLKQVLETIVEKEEIASIGMAHGEPILDEPFVKMAWYQNWVKILPRTKRIHDASKQQQSKTQ